MARNIFRSDEVAVGICKALGISPDRVRRVVLDCDISEPLKAYVEMYGDERFLNIQWTLDGAKVEFADKDKG